MVRPIPSPFRSPPYPGTPSPPDARSSDGHGSSGQPVRIVYMFGRRSTYTVCVLSTECCVLAGSLYSGVREVRVTSRGK